MTPEEKKILHHDLLKKDNLTPDEFILRAQLYYEIRGYQVIQYIDTEHLQLVTCLHWQTPTMRAHAFEYFHHFCYENRPARWKTWSPGTEITTWLLTSHQVYTDNPCPLCGVSLDSPHGTPE